jgi:hypothetical protein
MCLQCGRPLQTSFDQRPITHSWLWETASG